MRKKRVLLWLICLMFLFFTFEVYGQGLTSTDVFKSFKYRMKSDNLVFPDADIYQLVNFGTEIACTHGFAYQRTDTILLVTGQEAYGLPKLAIWVYRVGKIEAGDRSWQNVALGHFGAYYMQEVLNPAYYDFVTVIESLTTVFDAGQDTSQLYVYPKPTAADNGDSMVVCYFAWTDTLDGTTVKYNYHDAILELALMGGEIRKGRSDKAVQRWNKASVMLGKLRNDWLSRIHAIEVVPKNVGGK